MPRVFYKPKFFIFCSAVLANGNAHIDTFLIGAKFAENAVYVYFLWGKKDKPYDLVFFLQTSHGLPLRI